MKIVAQAMAETKSTDPAKLVEYFEKGATFDILKARRGQFRAWDHQLLQEMYVVRVKDKAKMKDKWDIFDIVAPVPGAERVTRADPAHDGRERLQDGVAALLVTPACGPSPCRAEGAGPVDDRHRPRADPQRPARRLVLHRSLARTVAYLFSWAAW